jgi:hypothetical protein
MLYAFKGLVELLLALAVVRELGGGVCEEVLVVEEVRVELEEVVEFVEGFEGSKEGS